MSDGIALTVEHSHQRIFSTAEYEAVGCRIVEPGSWHEAPDDTYIIGLKEPEVQPAPLRHCHVFFGHAYKGQDNAAPLLARFASGGGVLLDLECLTDEEGRRAAAFGFWAGYVGAALAVLHASGRLPRRLKAQSKAEFDGVLLDARARLPKALVIGALGRCGLGARAALATAGCVPTCWDVRETRTLDREALLQHEMLVNAVLSNEPGEPFLTPDDIQRPTRRLEVVSDVACDVTSACNRLPINAETTDWENPVRRLQPPSTSLEGPPALDILAIDNLPSLLPREASASFSSDLLSYLPLLGSAAAPWERCAQRFRRASTRDANGRAPSCSN